MNTVADSGAGSLRWALTSARAGDRIDFDPIVFPPDKPAAIMLLSALPSIMVDNLSINASRQGRGAGRQPVARHSRSRACASSRQMVSRFKGCRSFTFRGAAS